MALVKEDGSSLEMANSYADEDDLTEYAADRAITLASGDAEAALIRGSQFIDGAYVGLWSGTKTSSSQGMAWPRTGATDEDDVDIAADTVPVALVRAACEAAIRELIRPGVLTPDLKRGGALKRVKAGAVELEYADYAAAQTTFTAIENLLKGLLGTRGSNVVRLVRA